jgi:hypothetical protein
MSIIEKYKNKQKFYRINKLIQKYNEYEKHKSNLNYLLELETLQEYELEYLIRNFELNESHWESISYDQDLSEYFINKYKNLVDWENISYYQVLSEEFIEKHSDLVDWSLISNYQELSEEFRKKHKNKIFYETIGDL